MNENEAMKLRERIKSEFPWIHVDIQFFKPAGCTEACHTLWLWKDNSDALPIASAEEFEQWEKESTLQ